MDFSASASSPWEGTVKAESVRSYFWKKSFNLSREEATGNKNLVVCIEPLLFSKTNTKEVCGEPETAICSTVVHDRIHYPGDAPPVGVAEQEAMTNYWYRPENPGTGFSQAPDSSCT